MSDTPTVNDLAAELLAFVGREIITDRDDLATGTDLLAAGFDSFSLVNVLLYIEKQYGIWVPETAFTEQSLQNTQTLAATIQPHLHAR